LKTGKAVQHNQADKLEVDVFHSLYEKKKSVVPYLTFVEVASHWKFHLSLALNSIAKW